MFPGEAPERKAKVRLRGTDIKTIMAYMPSNYEVRGGVVTGDDKTDYVWVVGHDVAGWTLDGYVLPRLASGLIFGEEVI